MNPTRRRPWLFWLFALVVLASTATEISCLFSKPPTSAQPGDQTEGGAGSTPTLGVACLGLADVETGVTGLSPLNPGRVAEVCVSETEEVAEGQPLLRLDSQEARLGVAEAEEGVKAAEARVAQAEESRQHYPDRVAQQAAALEAAVQRCEAAKYTRLEKLRLQELNLVQPNEAKVLESQGRELEQLKRAEEAKLRELQGHNPELEVRRANAELAAARIRLKKAQGTLDECVLRAPCKGKVVRVLVQRGDLITGSPRQPALQFCVDGPRIIRAELMQEYASRVKKGDSALVTDDADLEATWTGKVERLSDWYTQRRLFLDGASQSRDARTLECIIRLDPGKRALRIGQRVLVKIGLPGPTPSPDSR